MIDRYSLPEMSYIWSTNNKFDKWLLIELLACEAYASMGLIPQEAFMRIKAKASYDIERIQEIELETKHDVIAFLTSVGEFIGEDSSYLHFGLTSSDVLDTSLAVHLKEAGNLLIEEITVMLEVLRAKAFKYKNTIMIGRSHGIHAEPVTFGLKMALWYQEMERNLERLRSAVESVSFGKISGAVGTFANIPPTVEEFVCKKLGLSPAPISTQIIQRDRHAHFVTTLAIIASSLEKFAVEVRHLQRTEVLEAEEFFSKGQKGSSAMPHKRNPIISEQVSGLARIIRGNAMASLENVPLWHERDISHSSVERIILPDSTILVHYMLRKMSGLVKNLVVYPENMRNNMNRSYGLIFSQHVLLELAEEGGVSREMAYKLVQRNAMKAWREKRDFKTIILEDKEILELLSLEKIESCFDSKYHTKHVDTIFERVFSSLNS